MTMTENAEVVEIDYSDPSSDDFEALSRDRVPVRSLKESDIDAIVKIDRRVTGRDHRPYFERMFKQVFGRSGVRVSVVAELDDRVVGYIMSRVDYGEFGRTEPIAAMDTIAVDPDFAHQEVATALMQQMFANLSVLRVENVRTVVAWNNFDVLRFLAHCGFTPAQRLSFRKKID